jgi:serine/threonine protein phosphatase PrpC
MPLDWCVSKSYTVFAIFAVLHEIHEEHDILLAGVFDGHGGTAASHKASQMVPYLMSESLREKQAHDQVRLALEQAWETTCNSYRHGCVGDECVANYDPMEGTLEANTGSQDLVAGTTASLVAVQDGIMTVLNCGDSRSLLFDKNGELAFSTVDHTPQVEMERLSSNPNYSTPKCSLSRWYLSVGDYQYAVARSLEGPFATSLGIVSDPDIFTVPLATKGILVMASDGLFEVLDSEEVGRDVLQFRNEGESAGDAAKKLCSLAIEKGTSDNVSVVVLYLE